MQAELAMLIEPAMPKRKSACSGSEPLQSQSKCSEDGCTVLVNKKVSRYLVCGLYLSIGYLLQYICGNFSR